VVRATVALLAFPSVVLCTTKKTSVSCKAGRASRDHRQCAYLGEDSHKKRSLQSLDNKDLERKVDARSMVNGAECVAFPMSLK